MKTAQDKHKMMTTMSIPKLITSLAVPTIISMLVTSFYVMADTYFVGQINTQSTAAVGISFSIMAIIQAFGFFFGHGSGNFISRKLGAKDYDSAEKMASTANMHPVRFYRNHTAIRRKLFRNNPHRGAFYGIITCTEQSDALSG